VSSLFAANAQVINSLSKDKSSFYGFALDTIVTIIRKDIPVKHVLLERWCGSYADSIQDIPIRFIDQYNKPRKRKKQIVPGENPSELYISLHCISIIKDEVKPAAISFIADPDARPLKSFYFLFCFYYQPESRTYLFKKFEHGKPYPR
jgi:hypothetical protein